MTSLSHDLTVMMPELVMAGAGLLLLIVGVLQKNDRNMGMLSLLAIIAMAGSAYCVMMLPDGSKAFGGAFVADGFARFSKLLILLGAALTLVMSQGFFVREKIARFEFPVLVIFSVVGMMLMVSASSFLALYMGLELQSLALYVLAAFNRESVRSSEAGLKYFVLGALSSGLLLYGISLIYGFTGTTDFVHVASVIKQSGAPTIGLIFGLVFLIAGLAFKVAAVPFHMWTPDVYEGSPTPITAFFAMSPKIAAMALFLRAIIVPFPDAIHQWQQIIIVTSVLSMLLGAFAAIGQTSIKRLMAYSSIGHMGYALFGLAAGTRCRRAGRPDLSHDLFDHECRRLLRHPGDEAQRRDGRDHCRSLGSRAHAAAAGDCVAVLHGEPLRHSAARRLFREVLCVPRRHTGASLYSRRHRRDRERDRSLLLSAHHQDHVFR